MHAVRAGGVFSPEKLRLIEVTVIAVAPLLPAGPICEFGEAYRAMNRACLLSEFVRLLLSSLS